MEQTVIKVGNSLAVTLPVSYVREKKLTAGQKVLVSLDSDHKALIVSELGKAINNTSGITPEFIDWLAKFNKKYKNALTELAKK